MNTLDLSKKENQETNSKINDGQDMEKPRTLPINEKEINEIVLLNTKRFNSVRSQLKDKEYSGLFQDDATQTLNSLSMIIEGNTTVDYNTRGMSWNIFKLDEWTRSKGYLMNSANWQSEQILGRGIDLNLGDRKKKISEASTVQRYLKEQLYSPLFMTFYLGYFHGGSADLIIIKGQTNKKDLIKPLVAKDLKKGDFLGLKPLTRLYNIQPYYGIVKDYSTYIDDIGEDIGIYDSTELGKPQFYRVSLNADLYGKGDKLNSITLPTHYIVHRSRLLIYNSSPLSYIEEKIEQFFGVSIAEKAILNINRYENLINQISKLMDRSNIPVYTTNGLAKSSMQGERFQRNVADRIDGIELAIRYGEMILINEGELFSFANSDFQHIPELLKEYKHQLISDLGAPASKIFNMVDSDDEHDFDYIIEEKSERYLRKWYIQLIPIIYKCLFGKKIGEYSFSFKPLEKVTQKEKAETLKLAVEIISIAWRDGVLDEQSYHRMLIASTDNINDMLMELNQKYMEYVEKNGDNEQFETYNSKQIKLAEALNKTQPDQKNVSREGGKDKGGNNKKETAKTTKDPINERN